MNPELERALTRALDSFTTYTVARMVTDAAFAGLALAVIAVLFRSLEVFAR